MDAAHGEPAVVGRGVEVGHQSLQGRLGVAARRRDPLDQRREERREVVAPRLGVERRPPLSGGGVDDRELDLLLVGVQVEEERVDGVDDLAEPGVGPVHLVDDEDQRQPPLERLAEHEARLRQRPLGGVDQQQHPVDHREPALDLAAEVGVPGGVDDVDLDLAAVRPPGA